MTKEPFMSTGAHYVLCRGIEKVTAELGLSFLACNLRRAINMWGVSALVAAMRGVHPLFFGVFEQTQ